MKIKRLLIISSVFIIVISVTSAFAFNNETDGFRGMRWGTKLSEVRDSFDLCNEIGEGLRGPGWTVCVPLEKDKSFGKAKAGDFLYSFWRNKFHSVEMYFKKDDCKSVQEALNAEHGKPMREVIREVYQDKVYLWAGDKTKIQFEYKFCTLLYLSLEINNEEKESRTRIDEK